MTSCARCRCRVSTSAITLHVRVVHRVELCARCCARELERMLSALSVEGKQAWLRRHPGATLGPLTD